MMEDGEHKTLEGIEKIRFMRRFLKISKDSLDAVDPHVQWGAEGFLPQSPPIK
ncbi:hypothetical protein HYW46_04555 [Candidatus Daviesbacteria bacterium]|nr:hypothetical protein [Candidatus Daviesbacteria bacterium]